MVREVPQGSAVNGCGLQRSLCGFLSTLNTLSFGGVPLSLALSLSRSLSLSLSLSLALSLSLFLRPHITPCVMFEARITVLKTRMRLNSTYFPDFP